MRNQNRKKNFKIKEVIYLLLFMIIFVILLIICLKNLYMFVTLLTVSLILLFYSVHENNTLVIKDLIIESDKIPKSFEEVKIIFFADIQLDYFFTDNRKRIKKIVNTINKMNPDIILFGGDFINKKRGTETVFEELKFLKAKNSIVMVYGNHDYYDFTTISKKVNELNITELKNRNITISNIDTNDSIVIAGIDDFRRGKPDIKKTLSGIDEKFTILLCHNPDYFEEMPNEYKRKINITLSGHTHGGQINLFGFAPFIPSKYGQKYRYGLKQFNDFKIYITSGIGAVTLPLRFLIKPEIINLKLRKNKKGA